jgi:3-oxoacyl-[acyl-carrier protein] reductase
VVRATRVALPWLLKGSSPSVVNISSISGLRPSTRTAAYGAAKAAVIHYTGSQAAMYARQGVRVNCIAPGSIEFPGGVWEERKSSNPALYKGILASIPFGRLGTAEEIAEVATFLASSRARWVTGQTIAVDGGQLLGA